MKVPEGPSDSLGMLEYLMRIVTPVSFAQVSKPGSVGQNRDGVYGERAVDSGKPKVCWRLGG